ncbi:MAG TPA: WYL domain-containing protein [Gemmatimonadaceae bacterium]|nr:WYL domain-containing protein [Gemmatimonadaceae bacterium]
MTASVQLRRLLAVLPELADGEERSYSQIAERVGAGWEVIRDDLHALSERQSAPGGFVEGVQLYFGERGVRALSAHFHRPMRLTVGELSALELGLAMIRAERPPEEHRAIERARERLRKVITNTADAEPMIAARHAQAAAGDSLYLARVSDALRRGRKVRLDYRGRGRDEVSTRTICPFGLVASKGMWYIVAHCEASAGVRIFRLDRIEGAALTDEPFDRPTGFSVDDVVRDGKVFLAESPPGSMSVRYSPRIARWIGERERGVVEEDGAIVVEHPVADVEWAVRHVLQYGPDAEIVEPAELREEIARRLREILDLAARER